MAWAEVGHSNGPVVHLGAFEIDSTTTHRSCPQRALDWDTYMLSIADVQAVANGQKPSRVWTGDE